MRVARQTGIAAAAERWQKFIYFVAFGLPLIPVIAMAGHHVFGNSAPIKTLLPLGDHFEATINGVAAYVLIPTTLSIGAAVVYFSWCTLLNWPFFALLKFILDAINMNRYNITILAFMTLHFDYIGSFLVALMSSWRGSSVLGLLSLGKSSALPYQSYPRSWLALCMIWGAFRLTLYLGWGAVPTASDAGEAFERTRLQTGPLKNSNTLPPLREAGNSRILPRMALSILMISVILMGIYLASLVW